MTNAESERTPVHNLESPCHADVLLAIANQEKP